VACYIANKSVKAIPNDKICLFTNYDIFITHHVPSDTVSTLKKYYRTFKKDKNIAKAIISTNTRYVYAVITYPLIKPAIIKFTCASDYRITYGMLLYLYAIAYRYVYELEDNDAGPTENISKNCFNRDISNGRFGIVGHHIKDLAYNGISEINVYDDYITCKFDCDS